MALQPLKVIGEEAESQLATLLANQQAQTQALQECQKQLACCAVSLARLLERQQAWGEGLPVRS